VNGGVADACAVFSNDDARWRVAGIFWSGTLETPPAEVKTK
jgi:hypothetical protein